jgi:hypothetical protein
MTFFERRTRIRVSYIAAIIISVFAIYQLYVNLSAGMDFISSAGFVWVGAIAVCSMVAILERQKLKEEAQSQRASAKLGEIYRGVKNKGIGFSRLAKWYDEVERSSFKSIRTVSRSIQNNYQYVLNFFENRNTNPSAESFNAKIKAFRSQFRGVRDIPF